VSIRKCESIMAGPLYRQIAGDLRRKIESGELGQRTQLPTEDQLMVSYHASRNTVRNALKELTTRGLVYTLHGKGTFVSELVSPILTTLTIDPKRAEEAPKCSSILRRSLPAAGC
jgi:DNA-binding GntR family transcriptional regulator